MEYDNLESKNDEELQIHALELLDSSDEFKRIFHVVGSIFKIQREFDLPNYIEMSECLLPIFDILEKTEYALSDEAVLETLDLVAYDLDKEKMFKFYKAYHAKNAG